MMPDLGKYAGDIYAAYGFTLALLAVLIWLSLVRSHRVKKRLVAAEKRRAAGRSASKPETQNG